MGEHILALHGQCEKKAPAASRIHCEATQKHLNKKISPSREAIKKAIAASKSSSGA
jgi:hypothetical protein